MKEFIHELQKRGFLYQATNLEKLKEVMNKEKISGYIGFDCTARSLHVGNLMQIMILRLLQSCGHTPIIIIGGGTSKIGDPSGKTETRKMLDKQKIEENIEGIKKSLSKFIDLDKAIVLNNASWLEQICYVDFLRDFGSIVSVNKMLTMESVSARLKRQQNLSFLEFNYMLLQAYDFYYLNKHHGCILQFGGSDQWGNIVTGIDLVGKISGADVYGITTPLLTTSSGAKMGKTANGAIWLNQDMLSPYDYYQFWRNTEDADLIKFAQLYAEFSDEESKDFKLSVEKDINNAKKILAFRLTSLCHGDDQAQAAQDKSKAFFETGQIDQSSLDGFYISPSQLERGIALYALIYDTKLAETKSQARRLIRGAGVRINDEVISDENYLIKKDTFAEKDIIKLSKGKKRHIIIKISKDES